MFYETAPGCCILHCFDRPFLPSQSVYGGKTTKNFPQVYFLSLFFKMSTKNTIVIKSNPLDIVIPYTIKEKKQLLLPSNRSTGPNDRKSPKSFAR